MAPAAPAVAAAAWLAKLPPAQLQAAQAHTDFRLVAWAGGIAALLGACAFVSYSGLIGDLRRRLEADRPRPWLAGAAAAGVLTLVLAGLKAVLDALDGWWGDAILAKGGGAPPGEGLASRLSHGAGAVIPVTAAAVALVPVVLWLMRVRPRTWPVIAGALASAVVLALGWLPYALSPPATPATLPAGPLRDGLMALAAETRLPVRDIYLTVDPGGGGTDVTGGFGHARLTVGLDLLGATPAEARAYVGHLIGHYVHNDIFFVCLLTGVTLALGFFGVQRWAAPLARRIGARAVAGPSDPEALPAAAMIAIVTVVAAALVAAAYLRWANVRADDYSLAHARAPDALAAVLVREWDHAGVDPSALEAAIFYTHPPLESRLVHAMQWKAAHGG